MECKIPILFEYLKRNKIPAARIVEATGISSGNISDWKSGKAAPTFEKLPLIADFLDISVDYLLGRTENPAAHKAEQAGILDAGEVELLSLYRGFNDEGKEEAAKRLSEMSELNRYKKRNQYEMADEA